MEQSFMSRFHLSWSINEVNEGKLIKDFLKEQAISRTALTDIKFKGGSILVNDMEVNVLYKLKLEDELVLYFPPEIPSEGVKGESIPLDIIYEDDYLLVVNKPSAMNTIPSREHPAGSLANALVGYYGTIGITATSHIVTRLDRNTSGLVLIAKHRHVHHLFSEAQKRGGVKRTYEAFASGRILEEQGRIVEPIGRKDDSIIEREVRADGQYACTNFRVLGRYEGFTHIELQLETGRTHQIRVHMAFLGHPLLGDDLYGGEKKLLQRQALHCRRLRFFHPLLMDEMEFSCELPEDMKKIIKS
jgi:23S rRNA pseudouridine1911/1915/1917 synthase